jgi:hypothetical protein
MNPLDLTPSQLRRAAAIKEQIESLNKTLRDILGDSSALVVTSPRKEKPVGTQTKRKVTPATRAKLRAKLKAYWAAKKARTR